MRLKSVWISKFKNIENLTVSFDGESFLEIFIGRNGSGKSNFLEAVVKIFYGIFSAVDGRNEFEFECSVCYSLDGNDFKFEYKNSIYYINGSEVNSLKGLPLPDKILVYYSGHNRQMSEALDLYNQEFEGSFKEVNTASGRRFIGVNGDYKNMLFSVLLLQPIDNKAKIHISEKLSIEKDPNEILLCLKRPNYALNKYGKRLSKYDVVDNDDKTFWLSAGETKKFLDRLILCESDNKSSVRAQGYLWEEDRYQLYFDISKIREEFTNFSSEDMFLAFDRLKAIGMLESISIPLTISGNADANINQLSDGQLQSVYIYAISELFKNSHCLTLMDEPDSFLHPEWQHECLKQIKSVSEQALKSNHILMSSHSAITLIEHSHDKVRYFDIKEGKAQCYLLPKRIAISKLSANFLMYSEQERLLSVLNTIQIENKPVLFTEGSTDPLIIKEAWYKLFNKDMPFIPFYAFSCTYINQLLTDARIHSEMNGLPVFAIFDFDKAFNSWNGLNGEEIQSDPFKGLVKKWDKGDSFAIMLPIPNNPDIKKQTFKNEEKLETYGDRSHCEIEHLLYGFDQTDIYFSKEPTPGGEIVSFKADGNKTKFAKEIVPTLPVHCFEAFRQMLDFVAKTCERYQEKIDAA
ncbi:AAA family ATPase [Pseudomonas sp. Y5-11]|uniref:ATP-dependent nuclease n=1 Tax=Pseudomonas sp. Y5-11 TaxID=2749808 RepID=UPI001EFB34B7|nr:AAA family ATPase [Pseudomonas sp. Y5-11]ULN82055.1 AAA family ATPase [Pseudomonas sp. Y5-11]